MLSDSRKRSRSSRAFAWIPPETLILAGAGAFAALGRGRWVTLIGDHGLWYSELQGLLCGGHLMHEVRVPYGPISMWLIWLAARLFGPTISTVAGFVFVAGLAAVVLVASFSLAFLSRSEQWCCAALLVVVILWSPGVGNLLYPYAFATGPGMVFALAALFAQRAALRRELFPLAAVAGAAARRGAWRDLVAPLALLCTLLGLVPLWSSKTTGDWRTTPYALYAKRYFPYERPSFGLDSTPAERPLPAGLTPFDAEFRVLHRRFTAVEHTKLSVERRQSCRQGSFRRSRIEPEARPLIGKVPFRVEGVGRRPPVARRLRAPKRDQSQQRAEEGQRGDQVAPGTAPRRGPGDGRQRKQFPAQRRPLGKQGGAAPG